MLVMMDYAHIPRPHGAGCLNSSRNANNWLCVAANDAGVQVNTTGTTVDVGKFRQFLAESDISLPTCDDVLETPCSNPCQPLDNPFGTRVVRGTFCYPFSGPDRRIVWWSECQSIPVKIYAAFTGRF
jgi:hypothetical protein